MTSTVFRALRSTAILAPLLLAAASCSSGGGGGSAQAPQLVAVAFVGAGGTPAQGDLLVLTLSRPVEIVAGATLDDEDLQLSSGTLGTVAGSPTAVSSHTVQIVLGSGVSFTPDTTTITFAETNDAIRSVDGQFADAGTPRTIRPGDGVAPTLSNLTLNGIEDELNGEGSAGGTLQVPRNGFTIDIDHADAATIDTSRTLITSDRPVSVDGVGARLAGANLAGDLTLLGTSDASTSRYMVPTSVFFGIGSQTLTAIVTDSTGMSSAPVTFTVLVSTFDNASQPFESTQTWFLDTSRDVEGFMDDLTIVDGANGTPDLEDIYRTVGLFATTPVVSGTDARVRTLIQDRILTELARLFDGVNVTFTFTDPGVFPGGETTSFSPISASGFSQICLAGSASATPSGVLGSALFDPNNTNHDNNCLESFGEDEIRLGVFPHAALRIGFVSGASSLFRVTYDPFTPNFGGTPIGEQAGDDSRLDEVEAGTNVGSDIRITRIDLALTRMARLLAVVTAHECGHSMGLVTNGPMPVGLYGDDAVNFPLSGMQPAGNASGHIQNTSLYPVGSQNVMSPAINFDAAQSTDTTFNTLNTAYLRERAIYVPN